MADSLGELFVELGVFADTKELNEFEEKLKKVSQTVDEAGKKTQKTSLDFKKLVKSVAGVVTAISGAVFALNKLTQSLVENNQHFLNLTRTSDIALSSFQKWDNIGRMFGVNNAASQLENLNERLFELKLTGQGAEGFMLAGINPMGQSAEGIMEQLRGRVAGLDDTAAAYLLRQMGLDPSMLHLLRLSRAEFEELGATIKKYQLTEDQTKQIQAMNVQLQIASIKLRYLKDRAVLAIMPYFVKLAASFARVAEGLMRIVKGIDEFLKRVPVLREAIIMLGAVLLAAFHPFIALFSAIYLIIDDVMAYMNGGGSIIGVIQKAFEDFEETGFFSENVPEWVKMLVEAADKWLKVTTWYEEGRERNRQKRQEEREARAAKREEKAEANATVKDLNVLKNNVNPDQVRQLIKGMDIFSFNPLRMSPIAPLLQGRNKNITNNDNKQVTMHNTIYTTETGETVKNDLAYAQNYAFNY